MGGSVESCYPKDLRGLAETCGFCLRGRWTHREFSAGRGMHSKMGIRKPFYWIAGQGQKAGPRLQAAGCRLLGLLGPALLFLASGRWLGPC